MSDQHGNSVVTDINAGILRELSGVTDIEMI